MNNRKVSALCKKLNLMLFRVKLKNCVHYPYARTNGASHRRVEVVRTARAFRREPTVRVLVDIT